jgi:hypothetical protein
MRILARSVGSMGGARAIPDHQPGMGLSGFDSASFPAKLFKVGSKRYLRILVSITGLSRDPRLSPFSVLSLLAADNQLRLPLGTLCR